ncbi:hypothetical protein PR048_022717 [Dryococelus australis]|uniref:Uncharacterized protein n=1 Tax=Dryococelus australis TaxID=614101 RepID=A0ABQ9GS38_9NEOP|nr:hypothetical protein PR048_022717 [Dryococelus australis]
MNKHLVSPSLQSVIKLRGCVCQVPVSPTCFRDASSKYKAYLEDCKKEKSELDKRLENLKKEGKTLQEAIQASHCLIGEANKRLSAASKSKNM